MEAGLTEQSEAADGGGRGREHGFVNAVVRTFLYSNLSLILIVLAVVLGVTALLVTPREEDPQIVVPLADVHVRFPGHAAEEVEQLVALPLEKLLYEIDGVEYVYSMSRADHAVITVRFYVGEDRERSLVKLRKRIDEHLDLVPPGVTGWLVKPVEIDDVPIVTLTLRSPTVDDYMLRRVAEELVQRLAAVENISRAYVVGGRPRRAHVYLDPDRLAAYGVAPLDVENAVEATNVQRPIGAIRRSDTSMVIEAGRLFERPEELKGLVVGVSDERPVFLRDVADIIDGPAEVTHFVRHGWGPAAGFEADPDFPGNRVGGTGRAQVDAGAESAAAVTIALAKKKGTNAVWVADEILDEMGRLVDEVVPEDIEVVITRNYGLTADEKVNELVEALAVAVFIVIALLTLGLGWRESLIVAVAVPVVFGLTLMVNLLAGFTINRVTLFALILSLGLLVDDPIVDVENISRHFSMRMRATRDIALRAVAEIRPPLIIATLAVIVSFLPMLFITGMMGPYMRPMALNVPVTMLMSMVVAFTITPWLAYHMLKRRYRRRGGGAGRGTETAADDHGDASQQRLARIFSPLMRLLLRRRAGAWGFLLLVGLLTVGATALAAFRTVPLKMLPHDNKNELLLVLDLDEGTTLHRTDAAVRELEAYLARVPEVIDVTAYVGTASPMDFNGMVRHYYLRQGDNVAEIRINLVGKKSRSDQSHALGLRLRDDLTAIADRHGARLKIVETPPGPPVISTVVAEVYGDSDDRYRDLIEAARTVRARLRIEPGVVDVDDTVEADQTRWVFVTDDEKAAISGVTVDDVAATLRTALAGAVVGTLHQPRERNPLRIELRLPRPLRASPADLARLRVKGEGGQLVPLAELGRWDRRVVDKTIYHKNLRPLVYVSAETAGRPPAEAVIDVLADRVPADAHAPASAKQVGSGWIAPDEPRPPGERSYLANGGGVRWSVPEGIRVDFAGEGEWKITLDVFRDLGLAFIAALAAIYILLVWQTGSFAIPVVVMLAIPLTIMGIMPGFWLLNVIAGGRVGAYADPIFFTATAMIGMIALAGIVTRNSVILVDFIHLALARGRGLADAIVDSCVVRLRPILLTAGTAMLSAVPITIDPIFSGLAWALIFGLFASTLFTLFVVPVTYWLVYARRPGHGLPRHGSDEAETAHAGAR
jgi:multidrug efflux pump subunit AcrB